MNINFNVSVKVEPGPVAAGMLGQILTELRDLKMSAKQQFDELNAKLDAATDEIAKDLKDLRDQLKDGMTSQEVQEVRDTLTAKITRLEEMGKDPADPIPEPTPEPTPDPADGGNVNAAHRKAKK